MYIAVSSIVLSSSQLLTRISSIKHFLAPRKRKSKNSRNGLYGCERILAIPPRTFQVDAVVGQGDSLVHPSHFIALNLHGQIEVIEFPGGDATHARIYLGPHLYGSNASLVPVTLQFVDSRQSIGDCHKYWAASENNEHRVALIVTNIGPFFSQILGETLLVFSNLHSHNTLTNKACQFMRITTVSCVTLIRTCVITQQFTHR